MNENERKVVVRRMLLLIAVACIIMGLYTFRLIFLQLVNGDSFKAKATNTTDYKFTVTAARGNIVDSTGKRIATTSTGYNVVLNKLQMGDQVITTGLGGVFPPDLLVGTVQDVVPETSGKSSIAVVRPGADPRTAKHVFIVTAY